MALRDSAVDKEACGRPDPVPHAFFYMNEPTSIWDVEIGRLLARKQQE